MRSPFFSFRSLRRPCAAAACLAAWTCLQLSVLGAPPSVTPNSATVNVNVTSGLVVYPSASQLVQTFTSGTRSSVAPLATGQLGMETDTGNTWYGTGTSAGNWSLSQSAVMANANSGFQIVSNGSGGYKLTLWNNDQSKYQEVRIAGSSGQERLIIGP